MDRLNLVGIKYLPLILLIIGCDCVHDVDGSCNLEVTYNFKKQYFLESIATYQEDSDGWCRAYIAGIRTHLPECRGPDVDCKNHGCNIFYKLGYAFKQKHG